jgi:hypothetical protein
MKNKRILPIAASVFVLALSVLPNAVAQCGGLRSSLVHPSNWHPQYGQARLLRMALVAPAGQDDPDSGSQTIVGFWHVKFVSEGSEGIPDGTEVDAGYSQWHSDGTEIMNSAGRSPITGSFCLGVWKQTRAGTYKLNHFAAAWDSTGSNLIGPANIREEVTLDPKGNTFAGTFTIDQYDEAGNKLAHVQGTITGTRIGVATKEQSIF